VEARQGAAVSPGRAAVADPERAFERVYEEHFDCVYRLAWRFGVPAAEVEDVAQRVFLVAHRRLTGGEQVDNVGGWLRGITVRVASQHRRWRRVRRVKAWLVKSTAEAQAPVPPTPERDAQAHRTQRAVGEVLEQMSPKLREVLVLSDVEDCTQGEVAGLLGISVNTVRSRRRLAREQFQRLWGQRAEVQHG